MTLTRIFAALTGAALCLSITAVAQAQKDEKPSSIKDFYGEYVGAPVSRQAGIDRTLRKNRKSNVVIKAAGDGFRITWVTIRRRAGDARKTTFTTLNFLPAGAPNRWRAKESKPLANGGPSIVASVHGQTLMIHVAVMDKEGNLITATYARTLRGDGMDLTFRRAENGRMAVKAVARLRRVEKKK